MKGSDLDLVTSRNDLIFKGSFHSVKAPYPVSIVINHLLGPVIDYPRDTFVGPIDWIHIDRIFPGIRIFPVRIEHTGDVFRGACLQIFLFVLDLNFLGVNKISHMHFNIVVVSIDLHPYFLSQNFFGIHG